MKEMAIFLNKIKEYNLLNELLECNSFDWISDIEINELNEINSLDENKFKNKLFNYIYTNDANYEIKKHNYLKKLKDNNNPYLDLVESILNDYEERLNKYFLKLNSDSSRKITIFDFLDLLANAKSEKRAKNAYNSICYLTEKVWNHLYEIEKVMCLCEQEKCSDIVYHALKRSYYESETSLALDYYINYMLNIKDSVCLERFDSFIQNNAYRFHLNNEENFENFFNIMDGISKFNKDELYKYSYIEDIMDYSPLPFSYNNINRIIKCDDERITLLINSSYHLCFLYMGTGKFEKYDIEKLTDIIYDVYLKSNDEMINFLISNMLRFFGILESNNINPIDYLENITKIDDDNTIQRLGEIVGKGSSSYINNKKKMKKLTKTLNELSINEDKNE